MDSITFQRGDILVQTVEGSNYIIPYTHYIIERVNEYSITMAPVTLAPTPDARHIRLTDPFKVRLNLKTFNLEYRDETVVCRFKKYDINAHYANTTHET
jgi:hypothetical protein